MNRKPSKLQQFWAIIQEILDERVLDAQTHFTRTHRFAHFWIMVWKSFNRNRCPSRAAALSYTTILALVPMLAVAIGITSSLLKEDGERRINDLIVNMVARITPPNKPSSNGHGSQTAHKRFVTDVDLPPAAPAPDQTNSTAQTTSEAGPSESQPLESSKTEDAVAASSASPEGQTNLTASASSVVTTNKAEVPAFMKDESAVRARQEIARNINKYVQNTRSGTLGVTGTIMLIFVAISMLARVEVTFNDIWGVARGRSWFMRIVLYWGVITLVPVLLVVAIGLASGPHLEGPRHLLETMPFVGSLLFKFLPVVVLSLTFSVFYMMPNTRVDWRAALVGGFISGSLFHLNSALSVLYVSRVDSNNAMYAGLGLVPVFMAGLYLCWLILLLGAQVAYAFQNRIAYLEERQVEAINQRGREFVAMRLATRVAEAFHRGERPPSIAELSEELAVPTRLITQIMQTLSSARLIAEVSGSEIAYVPARPLQTITCHDILQAMRSCSGQELATRDEPTRVEVLGEFTRIQEAERQAAGSVTLLDMANRVQVKKLT
jgi:membrane protein